MKELVIVAERKAEDYYLCMAASDGQRVKYDRRKCLKISPVCSNTNTENSPIHSHDCLRFIANKSPVYILQILPW